MFTNILFRQNKYDDWNDDHHYKFTVYDTLFVEHVDLRINGGSLIGSERHLMAGAVIKTYASKKLNVQKSLAIFYLTRLIKDERLMDDYIEKDMTLLSRILYPASIYPALVPCIRNQIKMLRFCNRNIGKPPPKKKATPRQPPVVTFLDDHYQIGWQTTRQFDARL